jgi:hypothetical protein
MGSGGMSAPTAAEAAKGLRAIADWVELTGQVPSENWPLVFRAPGDVRTASEVMEVARSLGAELGELQDCREEPDLYWIRFRGHVHGVTVDVTADGCASPALPFGEVAR